MIGQQLGVIAAAGVLSAPHCMIMCGGIVSGLAIQSKGRPVSILIAYNIGRVMTYTTLGAFMGMMGSFVDTAGKWTGLQGAASILGGVLILLWMVWKISLPLHMPHTMKQSLLTRFRSMGELGAVFFSGLLFGLIPCGLTYAMQMHAAASGSAGNGAAIMAVFGLSTIPSLLAVGLLAAVIRKSHRLFMLKAGNVLMTAMGILSILRGFSANGWIPSLHPWLW
ncbi:sulfite exporter TauE/SafE family protein [Paenibacillus sp. MBLB4367]|uniref:sulfite exporter TauE/SafE family protein n=1 Tax=Paenibacillus sp. MBLB4367 TaxID=3384767 RepID=UPI003908281A